MKNQVYADSTVAMTVYNILCRKGSVKDALELLPDAKSIALPDLDGEQFDSVLKTMFSKGMICRREGGLYPADSARRLVVGRDREDSFVDEDGVIHGGWNNWVSRDMVGAYHPIKFQSPKNEVSK